MSDYMSNREVYFTSSGSIEGSSRFALADWQDYNLSECGKEQMELAGKVIDSRRLRIGAIACSPIAQHQQSAQIIASEIGLHGPIKTHSELHDRRGSGLLPQYLDSPEELSREVERSLGIESPGTFARRVFSANLILDRLAATLDGEGVLVVGHPSIYQMSWVLKKSANPASIASMPIPLVGAIDSYPVSGTLNLSHTAPRLRGGVHFADDSVMQT